MTQQPLRIGVLGYRFMGKAHANALARLPMFFPDAPDIERHTLVGRDEEALADAAERFGFSHTATDWEDSLDEVDVFYNLGPNHVHAEPSIAALEAGVPVLCEKPLAPTLDEAAAMRATRGRRRRARRHRVQLSVHPRDPVREGADRRRRTRRDPTSSWAVPPRLAGRPRGAVGVADGRRHGGLRRARRPRRAHARPRGLPRRRRGRRDRSRLGPPPDVRRRAARLRRGWRRRGSIAT